jgi:hypothetical protein
MKQDTRWRPFDASSLLSSWYGSERYCRRNSAGFGSARSLIAGPSDTQSPRSSSLRCRRSKLTGLRAAEVAAIKERHCQKAIRPSGPRPSRLDRRPARRRSSSPRAGDCSAALARGPGAAGRLSLSRPMVSRSQSWPGCVQGLRPVDYVAADQDESSNSLGWRRSAVGGLGRTPSSVGVEN